MSALVLLHGFTGSPASFDDLERRVLEQSPSTRVFCPTLLGHDGSVRHEVRRFDQEIDRLAKLIARAVPGGAHLCGYSLGARVAVGLIARHPFLFRAATLIGVHPGLVSSRERAERVGRDEGWCQRLMVEGLPGFSRAWEAQTIFASQRELPPELAAHQRLVRSSHSAAGLMQALRVLGLGQMPSYLGLLAAPPFIVRFVAGSLDSKFASIARTLAARSRRAHLDIIEGAGHNIVLEAPLRLTSMLLKAVTA
jgi:2-succinyl-6-hydroxy-2,4-cyclohexadiene-1-carboxylate synthase